MSKNTYYPVVVVIHEDVADALFLSLRGKNSEKALKK